MSAARLRGGARCEAAARRAKPWPAGGAGEDDVDIATRLPFVHAANFLAHGLFLPFFPSWLAARGFGPDAIATLLACATGVRVLVSPRLAGLADRRFSPATVLVASHLGVAAAALALLSGEALVIVVAVAIYATASSPLIPVTDAVTIAAVKADPRRSYARLRVSGSAAFAFASVAGGALLSRAGHAGLEAFALPLLIAGCATLGVIAASTLRGWRGLAIGGEGAAPAPAHVRPAPLLALAVGAAALVQASHALLYGFSTIDWSQRGIEARTAGVLWAVGVAAEVALFVSVGRLGGARRAAIWLILGGVGATLRWLGLAAAPSVPVLVALQVLHGLSFGATHLGLVAALEALADPNRRAFWQGRSSAVGAGAFALTTLAAGPLHRAFGEAGHLAMAVLSISGLALAVVFLALLRQRSVASTPPSPRN